MDFRECCLKAAGALPWIGSLVGVPRYCTGGATIVVVPCVARGFQRPEFLIQCRGLLSQGRDLLLELLLARGRARLSNALQEVGRLIFSRRLQLANPRGEAAPAQEWRYQLRDHFNDGLLDVAKQALEHGAKRRELGRAGCCEAGLL